MVHVTRATSCFPSVFNTHQCLNSIFPLLIATGEYLSAHHWQARLRVLLKWCYTGPSTCNCVAAAQSWPLKGQAVIYLKWQQPHFYLPAEKKVLSVLQCVYFDSGGELSWCLFHVFACCAVREAASCLGHSGSATSWPLPASCHHDTKLQRNGLDGAQGLFTNPVKCWLLLTWLISTNMDYTGSVAFQPFL